MIITNYNYSPSVNIKRDLKKSLNYFPTPNGVSIYNNIISQSKKGIRSFNLIGAYGSGKSSFLLAFEKNINNKENYFKNESSISCNKYEILNLIGEYDSIIDNFAFILGFRKSKNYRIKEILSALDDLITKLQTKSKGLLIFIDEFGKYLEYAAKNNPEIELYFIQQVAELINDTDKNVILITTLHQDFNSYSVNLTKTQRDEWTKVKGRFCDIPFNEPVEQLLYLASKRLKNNVKNNIGNNTKLLKIITKSKAFPLKDYYNIEIADSIYPLDILSASVLTLALQIYGQNERSLFSFLEYEYEFSIHSHNFEDNPYYNLSNIYDYLNYNCSSFINSKANPHYSNWFSIKQSLERIENNFEKDLYDAQRIIKTIGLLNIFINNSAQLTLDFLMEYGKITLGIKNISHLINKLEKNKIIRFSNYSNRYKLSEGTDLDIELAINEAGKLIESVSNVTDYINKYIDIENVSVKGIFFEFGTPRVFKFRFSDNALSSLHSQNEIDGFVNIIFNEKIKSESVKEISAQTEEPILYGLHNNTSAIKQIITQIEKIKKVITDNNDDIIAKRELESILVHEKNLLNHFITENLFSENSKIQWIYRGTEINIRNKKEFNKQLSIICKTVYFKTPIFHNELINKTKLSGQIVSAKRNLILALLEKADTLDLDLNHDKFPPEKTIYLSLLKQTGIHKNINKSFYLDKPDNKSFLPLWDECENFFNSAKDTQKCLKELFEILSEKPFKLKKGFVEFWIPLFLIIKKEEFALFYEDSFVPDLKVDIFDSIVKNPQRFYIKTFEITGVKLKIFNRYREILQQSLTKKITKETFIESIKPFLIFYKNLPEYSKNTNRISKKAKRLREAIINSKDPEKIFFEDLPNALGYSFKLLKGDVKKVNEYVQELQDSIKEIRTSYINLLERTQNFLSEYLFDDLLDFESLRNRINSRFKLIRSHLLLPYQKSFYTRLQNNHLDRVAWFNSIAYALLNKALENINDNEETILYNKFENIFTELDNLCEISGINENDNENIIKIDITSVNQEPVKSILKYSLDEKKIESLRLDIKKVLSKNKKLNQVTLVTLLKEELKN